MEKNKKCNATGGKRRRFLPRLVMLVAALIMVLAGMLYLRSASDARVQRNELMTPREIAASNEMTTDEKVEAILSQLTLTEKIGQLVVFGISGKEADQDVSYVLSQFHYGGVVLFSRNIDTVSQVKALNERLQELGGQKVPMFICIDEEGGKVSRLAKLQLAAPAPLEIGSAGDPDRARESAELTGSRLKELGINVDFAPVADLGSLGGTRHFSQEPMQAAAFVNKACDGYRAAGIICSLKHFPGIGKGQSDSHNDSVVVEASKAVLYEEDLVPFTRVFSSHSHDGMMVMVSHVTYPYLTDKKPASISSEIMDKMLRQELGFEGIIITDDMEMGAVDKYYSNRQKGVAAIKAGADIVMMCHSYQHAEDMYMGILEAVKAGEISEARIDGSVRRVLRAKLKNI